MAIFRIEYTRTTKEVVEVEAADVDTAWALVTDGGLIYEGDGQNVVWGGNTADDDFAATKSTEITSADVTPPSS